ncbi:aminotransferase class V-fold PLP-dependent enzyme [Saccharibacillus sp. CPCC 101409]|uniref:cysteine desulfurase family protein n=1 Tax=Saccharibacillus sp. CPCC 101409 TaxID=3058041 RepID=UPI0026715EF3|nr:aminotransferase class V-fold PLP-dependent enzyme [Saccharibacillus sp. CPCC 101409]MDO3408387.1 aminotransferase class V-fold PLP-dependent enzyme [Saccharibacillus sp. CPCC 101409]
MLYLDNSATTKIHPEVLEAMMPYLQEEYGNPSSKFYSLAENAKKAVAKAREQVAALLGCDADEVVFTSGATESNNMIIKGIADYYGREDKANKRLMTTKVEHPSVIETFNFLGERGYEVSFLDVDQYARVTVEQVKEAAAQEQPLLTSIMWGNNEIGSLNPIAELSASFEENGVFFHTDATQVIGKVPVDLKKLRGIRFLSMSGHKIGGPKGIGAAIIRKQSKEIYTRLTPLMHGGGQENNYRSGTLAVHNIVGLGKAAELAAANLEQNIQRLTELERYLTDIFKTNLSGKIKFNSDEQDKIPGLISLQFIGVNNELLLKKLADYVALSSGSACSSSKPSHVLSAADKSLEEVRQTIRISLGTEVSEKDLFIFKKIQ